MEELKGILVKKGYNIHTKPDTKNKPEIFNILSDIIFYKKAHVMKLDAKVLYLPLYLELTNG
ncbi:MAG: hypothetical protein JJV94_03920 [Sulfurospirillum sp.]|nr:hypothetical protein [Sulfurospirillum sp.]